MKNEDSLGTKVLIWGVLASMLPGIALTGAGLLQLVAQVTYWMRSGEWQPLPAWLLFGPKQDWPTLKFVPDLYWDGTFLEWLFTPTDWKGIAQMLAAVLNWLSSPVVCVLAGFIAMMLPLWIASWIGKELELWRTSG